MSTAGADFRVCSNNFIAIHLVHMVQVNHKLSFYLFGYTRKLNGTVLTEENYQRDSKKKGESIPPAAGKIKGVGVALIQPITCSTLFNMICSK